MGAYRLMEDPRPPRERLSWVTIKRLYPNRWVVLVDADWSDWTTTRAAVHSVTADERTARALSAMIDEPATVFWTGERRSPQFLSPPLRDAVCRGAERGRPAIRTAP